MKKRVRFAAVVAVICVLWLGTSRAGRAADTVYEPNWDSLRKHEVPEWFRDAKFGIFVCWGVYSVPAWAPRDTYAEWYTHRMYKRGTPTFDYHKKHYGYPSEFGYKDFIPMWKAEKWDPDRWARLFKEVGARYVVLVAEHHDGFALWDSDLTKWDSVDMGPHRDITAELGEAVRERGMKYAPSYHRADKRWYYTYADDFDTTDPEYAGLYGERHDPSEAPSKEFLKEWRARWEELQRKYRPDLMWFDWKWGDLAFRQDAKEMMANYYNAAEGWGKEVAINNKTIAGPPSFPIDVGDFIEVDYMSLEAVSRLAWENPRGIGRSYSYNKAERAGDYNSVNDLVDGLADIVSKNGNLLLCVGPKADGTIPEVQRERLRGIGKWLDVNGEAIFDTRPWRTCREGTVRFTRKGGTVYAIALQWPEKQLTIRSMSSISSLCPENVESVTLLGHEGDVEWSRGWRALTIKTPEKRPCKHAYTFKITLKGDE